MRVKSLTERFKFAILLDIISVRGQRTGGAVNNLWTTINIKLKESEITLLLLLVMLTQG